MDNDNSVWRTLDVRGDLGKGEHPCSLCGAIATDLLYYPVTMTLSGLEERRDFEQKVQRLISLLRQEPKLKDVEREKWAFCEECKDALDSQVEAGKSAAQS